jgi:4-alpha-glucanotransferase
MHLSHGTNGKSPQIEAERQARQSFRPPLGAYHDSHDRRFRDPFGARPCGDTVTLRLMTGSHESVHQCFLCAREERTGAETIHLMQPVHHEDLSRSALDRSLPEAPSTCRTGSDHSQGLFEQHSATGTVFEKTLALPSEPGLLWYYFKLIAGDTTYYYHNNSARLGGVGVLCSLPRWGDARDSHTHPAPAPGCPPYQITVYRRSAVPDWFKRGVMYQIYVDRFHNGCPQGKVLNPKKKSLIHAHWDDTPFYIRDERGRVTRWSFFGGNLLGVIAKLPYLEELGVSVIYLNPIFEAASNHKYDTGDYHKIDPMYGDLETFIRLTMEAEKRGISVILDGVFSHTGADSRYFNRYGHYPELGAFQAEISPYYPWYRLECPGGRYDCWWGEEDLPNVDEMEPTYQEFILGREKGVARFWLRKGARGWRLDVADELPDEFLRRLRRAVKETDPEAVLIGEVWEDASNKISYGERREYFLGEELDSVMNYPLRDILLKYMLGRENAGVAAARMMSLYENYPPENFRATMNLIGSHDRIRVLTLLGDAPAEGSLTPAEREEYRLSAPAREWAVRRLKLMVLLQMTLPGVPCVYYGDEAGMEGYSDPYNRGTYPWGREDRQILEWHKRMIRLRKEYDVLRDGRFWPFSVGDDVLGFRSRKASVGTCLGDSAGDSSAGAHENRSMGRGKGQDGGQDGGQHGAGDEEIIVCVNRNPFERREFVLSLAPVPKKTLGGDEDRVVPAPGGITAYPPSPEPQGQVGSQDNVSVFELLSGQVVSPDPSGSAIGCSLEPLEAKVYYIRRTKPKKRPGAVPFSRRSCGILLHLTSLPSRWGIGDMGEEARRFVNFLASARQSLWQVLPLNPAGRGNSPYSSPSVMAGNPLLISPDLLLQDGLLTEEDLCEGLERLDERGRGLPTGRVDYRLAGDVKERLFRRAWARFRERLTGEADGREGGSERASFRAFVRKNRAWLDDYSLFMALRKRNNGLPWVEWNERFARRTIKAVTAGDAELAMEVEYQRFLQYIFQRQWKSLKDYANRKGIRIVGDIPIYADADSSDTWANRRLFKLDETGRPAAMGGVPPDYFSVTGQLWGNPVYNWSEMEKDGYAWWKDRIRRTMELYDYVRLDHFRGFEGFWEVPAGEATAENGRWLKGPGKRFFEALQEEFGDLPFIAEDLGYITPEVRNLRNILGLPGMRIFQFEVSPDDACRAGDAGDGSGTGYGGEGESGDGLHDGLSENGENCVYYSGTHDNDTLIGWCGGETDVDGLSSEERRAVARGILRRIYMSDAKWVIIPLQDVLGLGSEARMNTPGTAEGNWEWRLRPEDLEPESLNGEGTEPSLPQPEELHAPVRWLRDRAVESGRAHPT